MFYCFGHEPVSLHQSFSGGSTGLSQLNIFVSSAHPLWIGILSRLHYMSTLSLLVIVHSAQPCGCISCSVHFHISFNSSEEFHF